MRWEQFNTARALRRPGARPHAGRGRTERVATIGANFQISPQIVLKADYQRFRENRDLDRFDLGLGWSF